MGQKVIANIIRDNKILSSFSCECADNFSEKVIGLQNKKTMESTAGMVFPYKTAEDVTFHMGTVRFPIDILFFDNKNSLKKIYKNIKPGELATYSCAGVKNVLEICGGLSDFLDIKVGDKISISGIKNNNEDDLIIISKENKIPTLNKFNNLSVANKNNPIIKKASSLDAEDMHVFFIDSEIRKSSNYYGYKKGSELKRQTIYSYAIDIDLNSKKEFSIFEPHNYDYQILKSSKLSLYPFLNSSVGESQKILYKISSLLSKGKKVHIATSIENRELIRDLILAKIATNFGNIFENNKLIVEKIDGNLNHINLYEKYSSSYPNSNITIYSTNDLISTAGIPISDEIKENARKAYKHLEDAENSIKNSIESFDKNVDEYNKVSEKLMNNFSSTKGEYNQSIKRNKKRVQEYLSNLKSSITILNEIKDISTTVEVIDSIASSSKICADKIVEIFDLIDLIDSSEFLEQLTLKTSQYKASTEDLLSSIDRAKEYINKDILGLIILSD